MRSRDGQQKQEEFSNKIRLLDKYIAKCAQNKNEGLDIEFLLKLLASKFMPDPPQDFQPYSTKVIVFEKAQIKRFRVKQMMAEKGKQFVLNVNAYAPIRISVALNESKPKFYSFQGIKGIPIQQKAWEQLLINVQMQKLGLFTSVKLILEQIKIQHKNPKRSIVVCRPDINQQLEEYLKTTRGRSFQIKRSRSLARVSQNESRRKTLTATNFHKIQNARMGQMVKTKSQLFKFEKKKQFYIKHVQKMSPQKLRQFRSSGMAYDARKREQMANMSKFILICKLGLHIREQSIRIQRDKLKQIKLHFLCLDFVKIIRNKFKLKMTDKARFRMLNWHYLTHMPSMIYESSIKKARRTLKEALSIYMDFKGLQELGANSEQYITSVMRIQRFFKEKSKNFRERIRLMSDRLCVIYHLELSPKGKSVVTEKYLKQCLQKNITHFYINKTRLIELLREESL